MNECGPGNTTVVICAAGMGTRLGIGTTKALVDIDGTPLILRQLELLKDFDDIRIVVGFQAERLIHTVKNYRKDIMFAFNYQYETTDVADSLRKGMLRPRDVVLVMDGDALVNPEDFAVFLQIDNDCLALSRITSEEPVLAHAESGMVKRLSKAEGNMQWPGIAKVRVDRLRGSSSHVYGLLNESLPLPACIVRSREINTQIDYEHAIEWYKGGQVD